MPNNENTALVVLKKNLKSYKGFKDDYDWLSKDKRVHERLHCDVYDGELEKDKFEKWIDDTFTDKEINDQTKKKLKAFLHAKSASYETYTVTIGTDSVDAKFFLSFAKKLDNGNLEVGIAISNFEYNNISNIDYYSGKSNKVIKGLKYALFDARGSEN